MGRRLVMPQSRFFRKRTGKNSKSALANRGILLPHRPSRSTELNKRSRNLRPSRRIRAFSNSAFNNAIFTLEGHSVVQALQDRQLLSAVSNSRERNGSPL